MPGTRCTAPAIVAHHSIPTDAAAWHRNMADRKMADRKMADRNMSDRNMADRMATGMGYRVVDGAVEYSD